MAQSEMEINYNTAYKPCRSPDRLGSASMMQRLVQTQEIAGILKVAPFA